MRVAMVSEHADPMAVLGGVDAGGQNVHVASLAAHLARRGHQVTVYTRREAPFASVPEREELCPGVTVARVPVGPASPVPKDELLPLMDGFAQWMSQDWGRHGRPDVVHAHFWMSGLASRQAATPLGVPVAQTFHALGSVKRRHQGLADTSPPQRIDLERDLASGVDLVIATCSDEVAELAAMGASPARVAVVPCGVDTTLFGPDDPGTDPGQDEDGTRVLLAVGRLVQRKGLDLGLRVLQRRPDVRFVVVGGGDAASLAADPEARRLRALAEGAGVADRFHLMGPVAHDQIPPVYRSADIILSTPWYEPFGITPVEAAACARPVVGAAVGGLLDTVVDGETGLLVPPRDAEAVADAVASLLDDPARAASLGVAARVRAVERYDWTRVAEQTEDALAGLVARRRPALQAAATPGPATRTPAAAARKPAADTRTSQWLRQHRAELREGLGSVERSAGTIESWGARLAELLAGGGRVLTAGNGGSAAEAEHLAAELVGRFVDERRPLSAVSLVSDAASVTALVNDYGVEQMFARQVCAHGRPGDVVVLMSTSGCSPNVIAAAEQAHTLGLRVWALTGPAPNPLEAAADEAIAVAAGSTAAVQEMHLVIVHAVCAALDAALADLDAGAGLLGKAVMA